MQDIIIKEHNGVLCTSSLNIADVTGKQHANIIKDIERLNAHLDARVRSYAGSFFIESTYLDANAQPRKMYYLTKKGTAWLINLYAGEAAFKLILIKF